MTDLREFSDFVDAGLPLIKARDDNAWALGDIAAEFDFKIGRPGKDDPGEPKLTDLARAWNVQPQRVSEWRSVSAFYPENVRTSVDLPWSHFNLIRRAAQKDHPDYEEALEWAIPVLHLAERRAFGVRDLQRFIKGVYYEGQISSMDLPPEIVGLLPGAKVYWIEIRQYKDGNE